MPPDPQPPPRQSEPPDPEEQAVRCCLFLLIGFVGGAFAGLLLAHFFDAADLPKASDSDELGVLDRFVWAVTILVPLGALAGAWFAWVTTRPLRKDGPQDPKKPTGNTA